MTTITTRSGKGSPLTNDEVDANFTNLNTDKVEASGDSMTGNLSFGDNNKVILGTGNDLQLYHDGATSIITDQGTGFLALRGDGNVSLQNAAGTENKLVASTDGAVTAYYDNSVKFATTSTGIDVTGSITTDGLTSVGGFISIGADGAGDDFRFYGDTSGRYMEWVSSADSLLFRDGAKALFGNGSDLQIYHSGSSSFIVDAGTGNLNLQTGGASIDILGNSGAEYMARFISNGAASLYHDAAKKLETSSTGIDVTGTVTADAVAIGASTFTGNLTIDAAGASVTVKDSNDAGTVAFVFENDSGTTSSIRGASSSQDIQIKPNEVLAATFATGGDISFYDSAGSSQSLFWDASAERLGLGTTSPEKAIHVKTAVNNTAIVKIESTATDSYPTLALKNDAREYQLTAHGPLGDKFTIYDGTVGSHRFVIDSAGLIQIGNAGSASSPTIQSLIDPNTGIFFGGADILGFSTGGSEAMRLDSAQNLLVGTTTAAVANGTTAGIAATSGDQLLVGTISDVSAAFNRISSDGDIVLFRRDGTTTVGSIGTVNSNIYLGTGDTGLYFNASDNTIMPINVTTVAGRDSGVDLGKSDTRFKDLYLSGNVTSSGTFRGSAGSASTPTFLTDGSTGMFRASSNDIGFSCGGSERARINNSGNFGIGTTDITDSYKMIIEGSDQETADLTDAGTHGATLFLRATGEGVGSGGAVAFGTTNSNKRPFAAIKGVILDGTANSVGSLSFSTRAVTSDTALTERMRLHNNGRLSIGTFVPQAKLDVKSDGQYNPAAYFRNDGNATGWARADWYNDQVASTGIIYRDQAGTFAFRNDNSSGTAMETSIVAGNTTAGNIVFRKDSSVGGEVGRFDTSGNLLVGTSSDDVTNGAVVVKSLQDLNTVIKIGHKTNSITGGDFVAFYYNNVQIGGVAQNGTTGVSFNTSSDQRLKENIVDAPFASDDIDAIQVRSFDWKADGSHQKYGMVAQELQSVAPEAVSEGANEEEMMGVDYSKLVPMLVKEIQSLRARVAQLETN